MAGLYLSLRGYLSDQLRDRRFDQQPLEALQLFLNELGGDTQTVVRQRAGILQPRKGLSDELIDHTVQSLTADDWRRLDESIQKAMHGQFSLSAGLAGNAGLKILRTILIQELGQWLTQRLPMLHDPVGLLLERYPDEASLVDALGNAYAGAFAVTESGGRSVPGGSFLLLMAEENASERLLQTARQTFPGLKVVFRGSREEVGFYRERGGLTLEKLTELGLVCPTNV